jgi:hypothetical protein
LKTGFLAAAAAIFVLGGCETFEPYLVERETLIDEDGIFVYSDLMEDGWDGTQHWQFSATNYNAYPVCVSVNFTPNSYADAYSMGGHYRVEPGGTMDIGYVFAPANFGVNSQAWGPDANGNC